MPQYRIESLGELVRQMAFTPADVRLLQVAAAEQLLSDVDPAKGYPIEFVIFRITGFRRKGGDGNGELLTGLALQHDLGRLIETVSDSLNLRSAAMSEPVLSIDDAVERFNVTSKTIQRWRRKGLPARRFVFPDGKKRVGFLLSRVERFVAASDGGVTAPAGPVGEVEQQNIVRRARRLAAAGLPESLIGWRIARVLGRSTMGIVHTLRKHDADFPSDAILRSAVELDDSTRSRLLKMHRLGKSLKQISRRVHQPRFVVYRTVLEHRLDRLSKRKLRYADDELFHGEHAEQTLIALAGDGELAVELPAEDSRVPRNLPPYLRDVYRVPLLTPARERALFLLLHFYKRRFEMARRKFEPQFACRRDLLSLESILDQVVATKNQILRANLRLVVSVARKHERPGAPLMELVSEGNLSLMRAVDAFDPHKGTRFSTYATLALMKGFARAVPLLRAKQSVGGTDDRLHEFADARHDRHAKHRLDADHVRQLLSRLDDDERRVVSARFGLDERAIESTLSQAADRLGWTRERVRSLEQSAMLKLRVGLERG